MYTTNNDLHKKYLQEYTLEVANDPTILPASVIAMAGKCRVYNEYGDLLNISNEDCLDLFSEFGKIPKNATKHKAVILHIHQICKHHYQQTGQKLIIILDYLAKSDLQ